ncbi:MAG TPA: hypothetical protein VJ764_05715 [Steroidobacteraceae bacterium]|nr:hypothetical protein [Steroidobacteraceae bacterium]
MSGPKPKSPENTPPNDEQSASQAPADKKSGRVTFDARGNAVWEWAMSTGIFGRDVDSERLKKLEAPDLKIAEDTTRKGGKSFGTSVDQRGPGFDPYNTHSITGAKPDTSKDLGRDPYNTAGSASKASSQRGGKPTDLKRLSDWIKRQRELQKKDDE